MDSQLVTLESGLQFNLVGVAPSHGAWFTMYPVLPGVSLAVAPNGARMLLGTDTVSQGKGIALLAEMLGLDLPAAVASCGAFLPVGDTVLELASSELGAKVPEIRSRILKMREIYWALTDRERRFASDAMKLAAGNANYGVDRHLGAIAEVTGMAFTIERNAARRHKTPKENYLGRDSRRVCACVEAIIALIAPFPCEEGEQLAPSSPAPKFLPFAGLRLRL